MWLDRHLEQQHQQGEPERSNTDELGELPYLRCNRMDIEVGPLPTNNVPSGGVVSPPRAVVGGSLARIAQRPVGFVDGLKAGLCLRARVEVGMALLGTAVIRRPDLVRTGPPIETETRVVSFRV